MQLLNKAGINALERATRLGQLINRGVDALLIIMEMRLFSKKTPQPSCGVFFRV